MRNILLPQLNVLLAVLEDVIYFAIRIVSHITYNPVTSYTQKKSMDKYKVSVQGSVFTTLLAAAMFRP